VPMSSSSSLFAVLDVPSMLFLYLSTTSTHLLLLVLYMYSAFNYILVVIPLHCGKYFAHSVHSYSLSYHKFITEFGDNGSHFHFNMCGTHPIGIFLP
jgi:hypothetical protein